MCFRLCLTLCFDAMVNKLLRQFIFVTMMLFSAAHAWADLVIVTSEATGISTLSKEDVINIYLGRYRRLPNALPALPIDMAESSEIKKKFYWLLVGKTLAEINSYWSRLIFSGQTQPPAVLNSSEDAIMRILRVPGTIGYIERGNHSKLDKRLVVVLELAE